MEAAAKREKFMALHSSETTKDPELSVPSEIFFDILTRLPVESLLRLRCVCKLWFSIISDPYFIKSHLSLSATNNLNKHHRLIFNNVPPRKSIKSCPLYDVLYDGESLNDALELDYPLKHQFNSVIAGSCNGLILIKFMTYYEDNVLCIWNPSTRRFKRLPSSGIRGCTEGLHGEYQFGYDESTHDYQVVAIFGVVRGGDVCDIKVKVYSLKTGIWKKIGDDFRNEFPINLSVKYLNGALYWSAGRTSRSSDWLKIVSLDLAKETYAEILQPVYDEAHTALTLGVLGGWLCVLSDYGRIHADIWVMKVKDSWTKLVSIPYPNDFKSC